MRAAFKYLTDSLASAIKSWIEALDNSLLLHSRIAVSSEITRLMLIS